MSEELKKCPFCGGEDVFLRFKECVNALGCINGYYYVECQYCATVSGCSSKENIAIEDWNTRPEEERLKSENEALIRHVEGLTARLKAMEEAYEEIFKKHIPEKIVVIK